MSKLLMLPTKLSLTELGSMIDCRLSSLSVCLRVFRVCSCVAPSRGGEGLRMTGGSCSTVSSRSFLVPSTLSTDVPRPVTSRDGSLCVLKISAEERDITIFGTVIIVGVSLSMDFTFAVPVEMKLSGLELFRSLHEEVSIRH